MRNYSYSQEKDFHISTLCLKLLVNTFRNKFNNSKKILENDIMVNVWAAVDQMLNSYDLEIKR